MKIPRSFTFWKGGYDEAETHQAVSELCLQGKYDIGIWYDLDTVFPLDEINAAFEAVWARQQVKGLVRLSG